MIALNSRAVNTSKVLRTSTPCYGQIVRLQHVVLPVRWRAKLACYCSRNEAINWFASVAYTLLPLTASP